MNIYKPLFIWNTAIDFYNLGFERCKTIFGDGYQGDKSLYLKIAAPAINISFSVELFLKGIALHETGSFESIHTLKTLFSKIPEHSKTTIIEFFESDLDINDKFPSFMFLKDSHANSDNLKPTNNFESSESKIIYELELHDNSFINWRYIFELPQKADYKREYNFEFMIRFGYCCFRCTRILQERDR